ncbi:MAG: bifunctional methylenetetrahydrofolate dehydrogenase/methenyltetrahydrofolate cyclohydrolase FolD [Vampirovibrionales bacterium]|nr:bifunctional methylenetetrahydrofolate dehydrogenase/methenyltetrahydrofolate cyclohydrolase FolD [Vampirovibrionales bacterium]
MAASSVHTTGNILDGKMLAAKLQTQLAERLAKLPAGSPCPKLVVVLVGDNPASHVYVNKKAKTAQKIGMASEILTFPADASQETVESALLKLNQDASVHGILVQLPLPKHLDSKRILNRVHPEKDVDGLHPFNLGRMMSGDWPPALPCTPAGMMTMLKAYDIDPAGKHAVVIGRSNIVGKPIGMLLLAANATVTYCHSQTPDLAAISEQADILVAAVGVPELVKAEHIKPGAVILDVGTNRLADGRLVGDVDFQSCLSKAAYISPSPGGVGPMTIATLMENTLSLYQAQTGIIV